MSLKGNPRTLAALKRAIKAMPITAAARIAARAAPEMTGLARGSFDAGQTAYDTARPRSVVDGHALTLVRENPWDKSRGGTFRRAIEFAATGRDIRLTRLPSYGGYLIGKYRALPNGPLPVAWRERMTDIAAQVLHDQIFGGS